MTLAAVLAIALVMGCGGSAAGPSTTTEPPKRADDSTSTSDVASEAVPEQNPGQVAEPEIASVPNGDTDRAQEGSLPKNAIRDEIRRHLSEFRNCYERELLKEPKLEGRVQTGFTIGTDGTIIEVTTEGFPNPDVEKCVADVLWKLRFPKPHGGGIVVVRYPFVFQSSQ